MKIKYLRGLSFLVVGSGLFWYVYHNIDLHSIKEALLELKYSWIFLSFILGLLSHLIRSIRWKMLIEALDYKPKTINLFLSVLILYFINLAIPRGGEVARCVSISKYEKIPIVKLLGTVFIERLTDFIAFIFIFILIFIWQFEYIKEIFSVLTFNFSNYQTMLLVIVILLLIVLITYIVGKKIGFVKKFSQRINKIKEDIKSGIKSISQIRNRWIYFMHTILIFTLWLFMLYVIFFAYPPTNNMTFASAIFAYAIGTFAYLLPIQAGIGVWHFLVIQSLFWFGLDKSSGMLFALIAHTFTNVVYLIFGTIGFILLPWINLKEK